MDILFMIPAGDATETLNLWSAQASIQILYDYPGIQGIRTEPIFGFYEPSSVLHALLRGSGAHFDWINGQTIVVLPPAEFCRPELGAAAPLPPCTQRIKT